MKRYSNFVRPSLDKPENTVAQPLLSGEEAKRIYLEEVQNAGHVAKKNLKVASKIRSTNKNVTLGDISKKDLFISVQNDDVETLICILDTCPDLLNITDEYGWSLLMIACQANSVNAAKELVNRGVNTSVRDKAGNSAQSLVIKNRNLSLVDILLSCNSNAIKNTEKKNKATKLKVTNVFFCEICNKEFSNKKEHLSSTLHNIGKLKVKQKHFCEACNKEFSDREEHLSSTVQNVTKSKVKKRYFCEACKIVFSDREEYLSSTVHNIGKSKVKEKYFCKACDKEFSDKEEHLSSTVHNISASKDKKIPSSYVIPPTNKGFQLMLKVGWDKESGLGRNGSGKKYPIKTVQKKDRMGLGLDKRKRKVEEQKETVKHINKKTFDRECRNSRNLEINFRRQFY